MAYCNELRSLRKDLDNWRKWSGEWEAKAKELEAENAKLRERIGKIISLRDGGW